MPPDATTYELQFLLDDFDFGLQRLLDGIASFIDARRGSNDELKPSPPPRSIPG